ncbi:MAG: TetR/AcrR family transcriptional regulator [Clostridia bacterium]|nr:TetR/AcrR family transcriptional regulator [Clostridia bacterium]
MKKGDATKQEILNVADRLFCTKGYDDTSVQDILDVMHGTKGGFYHHFPSKAAVLETLCRTRAEKARESAEHDIELTNDFMERINTILQRMIPIRMDDIAFVSVLLPLLDRPEGMSIRVVYQEALLQSFTWLLTKEVAKATAEGILLPICPDIAIPVLTLLNACWLEAAKLLLEAKEANKRCDTGALQNVLARYRRSIEVLLDAPYGSIQLIDLDVWDKIAQHLTMPKH